MSLLAKLETDLNVALKKRDDACVSTLRFLLSNIHNAKIAKGEELSDDEIIGEISKDVKRHKESIEAYKNAGRSELVAKETRELEILTKYLPAQMEKAQITKIVDEVIAEVNPSGIADMGKVMALVMTRVKEQADGLVVAGIVKGKLSQK
ncbi:hypothetical protein A2165_00745 [Candidatus Curtissbacteria bacterium RBG_13_40_7]|uniref:Glutamyl-tRNA amidotransferase n=1 Tax=Candidatus Curtissbacteria bacterium RBG_13_40_7 TaxID=1797706 RepID=A0A1F5FUK7_9BACT|nr:MAG: hypothetical protein A2165_00745 [Candidatus Curtissbacteria bacterium RBG_13_40_7]